MKTTIIALLMMASVVTLFHLIFKSEPERIEATLEVIEEEEDKNKGFARAVLPETFHFPHDHGPHPEYRIEWWYYTGNLRTVQDRYFGYQLTFFRLGLLPHKVKRASAWAANEIYMAHFTVTDVENNKFHSFERFSRAALGLAGAGSHPFYVRLEDWTVIGHKDDAYAMDLQAQENAVSLQLTVTSEKPVVLQGDNGLSQKSPEPGNASYYYSLTRLFTEGTISIGSETFHVRGLSWMDREWSTSALGDNQAGWDWFSLQLSDNSEIMYYQLRQKDGTIDPLSAGTFVNKNGRSRPIKAKDVRLKVLKFWETPDGEAKYPAKWRLSIKPEALELEITPRIENQEVNHTVRYFEGAVKVQGYKKGRKIHGSGYVELTGYSGDISERM